jgi:hypothetical protein
VEAARRRAEKEVAEKVERARKEALSGAPPEDGADGSGESADSAAQGADQAPAGEPAGTRYVRGRRLRTF